jgi:crotonobetainyl-CoA:carnitine CoA-transferase CaiB-like acyl-CoA transferase
VSDVADRTGLPLYGIRVIDLSQVGAGPYASSMLGDFGAEVVKVEPLAGEPFRNVDTAFGPGDSAYFFGVNRSKRGVALNLKAPEGRAVLLRMLEDTDIVVVSMRPAACRDLGIDYESLKTAYPKLIYCSITAFGESGPREAEPGMDILAQALGGLMGTTGAPDGTPAKAGPPVSDFAACFLACFGIMAALRSRDQTGQGQKMSISLLDATVALLANYVTPHTKTGVAVRPVGGGHPQIVPYQTFHAADQWFVLACLTEAFWRRMCAAIDRKELIDEARFATNSDRVRHRDELESILADIFRTRPADEWIALLRSHDVPVAKVNRLEDVIRDPQVLHNDMLLQIRHPRYGEYTTVNNPLKLSATPAQPYRYPPSIGEHTREVLTELGYREDEIDLLIDQGAAR